MQTAHCTLYISQKFREVSKHLEQLPPTGPQPFCNDFNSWNINTRHKPLLTAFCTKRNGKGLVPTLPNLLTHLYKLWYQVHPKTAARNNNCCWNWQPTIKMNANWSHAITCSPSVEHVHQNGPKTKRHSIAIPTNTEKQSNLLRGIVRASCKTKKLQFFLFLKLTLFVLTIHLSRNFWKKL